MTAPDARQNDELREALERLIHAGIVSQWQGSMREDVALTDPRPIVRDLLPVVTAWHEKTAEAQARARAAEELRKAADELAYAPAAKAAWLRDRADALAADDRTDPA